MTNAETAAHLRQYVTESHGAFSWPTDACGYDQHIRFVKHRNANWTGGSHDEWKRFVLDYANSLESSDEPPNPSKADAPCAKCGHPKVMHYGATTAMCREFVDDFQPIHCTCLDYTPPPAADAPTVERICDDALDAERQLAEAIPTPDSSSASAGRCLNCGHDTKHEAVDMSRNDNYGSRCEETGCFCSDEVMQAAREAVERFVAEVESDIAVRLKAASWAMSSADALAESFIAVKSRQGIK